MASVEKVLADERPHLIVLRGPSLGDFFALKGEALVLGSDPFRADVVVRDIAGRAAAREDLPRP